MDTASERRHRATGDPWWAEAWSFDLTLPDASLAMFATVTLLPNQRVSWYWAAVVGPDRPYVLCRADDLAVPAAGRPIELRGEGVWMHAICEEPWRHWTVAMEAFAVELDDPATAWADERGERIGLAFDLEWEGDPGFVRPNDGYELPCTVNGDLQIGDEVHVVETSGWRSHAWGHLDDVLGVAAEVPHRPALAAPLLAMTSAGPQRLLRVLDITVHPPRWRTTRPS